MHRALPCRDPAVRLQGIPVSATTPVPITKQELPGQRAKEAPQCAWQLLHSRGRHLIDVLCAQSTCLRGTLGTQGSILPPFLWSQVQGVGGGSGVAAPKIRGCRQEPSLGQLTATL